MYHIQGNNRNQIRMLSLEQMVEPESMVRIVDSFVDMLDLEKFDFNYFQLKKEGRPPYHPSTLMKLYLYGYQNSLRTCRKLEKACKTNIEVMWLINEQRPHFKTIANFRKDNPKAFKGVFRYFVAILKDWKLIDGKTIAIDSFKIRAQNSLKNNFNQRKVKRHIDYIDKRIAEYEHTLDKEFDETINDKLEYNHQKKENYKKIQKKLKQSGDGQISTTDTDSRAVVFQRNSVKVGYNVQAVSDSKNKLLIAADTGDVNDTKALAVMVNKAKENIGDVENVLADKGYHSGRELKACEKLGVTTFISPKESSSTKKNSDFAMKSFVYDKQGDTYACPASEILYTNGKWYNKTLKNGRKSYQVKHYKTKACNGCHLRSQCTTNKHGRLIERTEYQQYVTRNNDRVNQNPEYYRQRQQIIEHQFGTIKRQWHFDYTLTKGKEKVLGEVYLIFTGYNLRRLMSIFDFKTLMSKIKAHLSSLFDCFNPFYIKKETFLIDLSCFIKNKTQSINFIIFNLN
ncbi:MAG: IS1182 family transposase [Flavobacteriaceae bacterium]|nr:IS1182 family transposase [Flavobacteriaceae bacterium]